MCCGRGCSATKQRASTTLSLRELQGGLTTQACASSPLRLGFVAQHLCLRHLRCCSLPVAFQDLIQVAAVLGSAIRGLSQTQECTQICPLEEARCRLSRQDPAISAFRVQEFDVRTEYQLSELRWCAASTAVSLRRCGHGTGFSEKCSSSQLLLVSVQRVGVSWHCRRS